MQLHQLTPQHKQKTPKRIGRGGKKGTYCGRGIKGQKARAGTSYRPDFAGGDTSFVKRLPNKRGFVGHLDIRHGVKLGRLRSTPIIFNLGFLNDKFEDGETVSPKSLEEKGIIKKINKRSYPAIKVLGNGDLKKSLKFKDVVLSGNAKKKAKSLKS